MAKTMERPIKSGTNKGTEPAMNLIVSFGKVSIGEDTANIGVSFDREGSTLTAASADKNLCGRRLIGRIVRTKDGEDPNQTTFLEGERHQIASSFDVKSIRISPKKMAFGVTFNIKGIAMEELHHFAKRNGRLIVDVVTSIPDSDDAPEDEDEEEELDEEEGDDAE